MPDQEPPFIARVPVFSTLCNAAFRLRREVFVVEQGVPPEIELDEYDLKAQHFVAVAEGEVIGTLRVLLLSEHAKFGRVAVDRDWRGRGVARRMIETAMAAVRATGQDRFYLAAQIDKLGMYARLGFVVFGDEFMDGGMPHRAMRTYDLPI